MPGKKDSIVGQTKHLKVEGHAVDNRVVWFLDAKMIPVLSVQSLRTVVLSFSRSYSSTLTVPNTVPKIDPSLHLAVIRDDRQCQQLLDFVYEETYPRESVRKVMAIGQGAFSLIDTIPTFLNQGVSIMLTDVETEQVIGCAINRIVTVGKPDIHLASHQTGRKAVISFIKRLQNGNEIFHQRHLKTGMEMFYVGVKEPFSRRGLASYLAQQSTILASENKLDFIQSFPTNRETSNLFESLEFETINEINLVDHFVDGAPAFPQAGPGDVGRFVVKML